MAIDKIFYDIDKYIIRLDDTLVNKGYFHPKKNSVITVIDVDNCCQYTYINNRSLLSKNIGFHKLTGEIYLYAQNFTVSRYVKTTVFEDVKDGNLIRIVFDGITTLTIEDKYYIYRLELPYYADINVNYQENIFIISFNCTKKHVIILKKQQDYIEIGNFKGDEIDIGDHQIHVTNIYHDSLGRIKEEYYELVDDSYKCIKHEFRYTYNIVYKNDYNMQLLEDALYSGDFDYIKGYMQDDVSYDELKSFFDELIDSNIYLFRIEPSTHNTCNFITKKGIRSEVCTLNITFDEDKIVNIERV